MAQAARNSEHRIICSEHMAKTWERIARSVENGR